MNIPKEQTEKLKRYFINADPFMWGVLKAKNKKGRLKELKDLGYLATYSEGSNPTYAKINRDLLVEIGIEGIVERIVVPRIVSGFSPEVLRNFRDCWQQGQTPDLSYLKRNGLYLRRLVHGHEVYKQKPHFYSPGQVEVEGYRDPAFIFVQIDTQHSFVERWTVFAGLWFEFIEPSL